VTGATSVCDVRHRGSDGPHTSAAQQFRTAQSV